MIIKKENATNKQFLGVDFVVLAIGEKSMVTKMLYKTTDNAPTHSHQNEQNGYVVSGKYRLKFGNFDEILESGDSYSISANTEHSIEILEAGEVVDIFTPIRKDYL